MAYLLLRDRPVLYSVKETQIPSNQFCIPPLSNTTLILPYISVLPGIPDLLEKVYLNLFPPILVIVFPPILVIVFPPILVIVFPFILVIPRPGLRDTSFLALQLLFFFVLVHQEDGLCRAVSCSHWLTAYFLPVHDEWTLVSN